jgi:hypothetical protein
MNIMFVILCGDIKDYHLINSIKKTWNGWTRWISIINFISSSEIFINLLKNIIVSIFFLDIFDIFDVGKYYFSKLKEKSLVINDDMIN